MIFVVGGGGQGKGPIKKGTIVVTYPEGSTCTVTGNGKTYTALDTSGAAAFVVEPGTWTVTATPADGGDPVSESVTVAAGGWVEVELSFGIFLYRKGREYVEWPNSIRVVSFFNGGGGNMAATAATKQANSMLFASTASSYLSVSANSEAYDFTRCTQLIYKINKLTAETVHVYCSLTADDGNKTVEQMRGAQSIAGTEFAPTEMGEFDIKVDTAGIAGEYYAAITLYCGEASDGYAPFELISVEVIDDNIS